jgi:hypothetical protein
VTHHAKAPSTGSALRAGSRLGRIVRGAFATPSASRRAGGSGAPSPNRARVAFVLAGLSLPVFAYAASPALGEPGEAPAIDRTFATAVRATSANLNVWVDPNGSETAVHFEYGLADCSANSCASTAATNFGAEDVEDNAFFRGLEGGRPVTGLTPGTTYHYRAIATNAAGTTEGPDRTFTTFPLADGFRLPDNRGYEMVTPLEKNGGDVAQATMITRSAADGNAVSFASRASFGDSPSGGGSGGAEYIAERRPTGWVTHGISPDMETANVLNASLYVGDFSANLDRAIFLGYNSFGSDPFVDVSDRANLYLRTDALTPGLGSYTTLSSCPACSAPLPPDEPAFLFNQNRRVDYVDATPDLGQILFEDKANLTQETVDANGGAGLSTEQVKLYEWDHGTVRLAGILPDSACGSPPPCPAESSYGGSADEFGRVSGDISENTISDDGRRINFTAPPFSERAGTLYERVDHATTIQVNASERSTPEPPRPASFGWATPDGKRVFFTTEEALTDDGAGGGYMYDVTAPAGERLTFLGESIDSIIGGSDDGNYVYFVSNHVLVPGQHIQDDSRKLYVWHEEDIRAIAGVDGESVMVWNTTRTRRDARVTPDGKSIVFLASPLDEQAFDDLTGYDSVGTHASGCGFCPEVYVYNYERDQLSCASCPPTNSAPEHRAGDINNYHGGGAFLQYPPLPDESTSSLEGRRRSQWISNDGRFVFFSSPADLVPEDINGVMDAYEYDAQSGQVRLISTGQSGVLSVFLAASPDGHDVFFTTRQQLVPGDTDSSTDLYDARVDGGIPEPARAPTCEGDACQASPTSPNDPTPASSGFNGAGNTRTHRSRSRKRCAKGRRRAKVRGRKRCVRKSSMGQRNSRNRASTYRRATR